MDFENIRKEYATCGFTLIEEFLTPAEVDSLSEECSSIVKNMELPEKCSVFHTGTDQSRGEYFINSGDKISYFFEKDATDEKGNLIVPKEQSLNKIGHALHWWNSKFKNVTFSQKVKDLLHHLDYQDPVIVQSMVIFKHPEIGGEVTPHQDSTFLYTDPTSAIGLWFPLVDVTLDNGCLWFLPGSHKDKVHMRYLRNPAKDPLLLLKGELPELDDTKFIPVLAKKGDCVVIHGSVIHKSGRNTSDKSRLVYTFHAVENKDTIYSQENWLQPSDVLPFPSLYSH